jgi:hypothetical protein
MQPVELEGAASERAVRHVALRCSGARVAADLRVTLNFHPDRLCNGLLTVESLRRDGLYRSQFETGTSNGGLTAYEGGARWKWESSMFGAAYDGAPAAERPKYGSLNFRRRAGGGSPRFGSCYLRLRPETLARTSFCYPDSYLNPVSFGVAEAMPLIPLAEAHNGDALDDYIEAHVHGLVRLGEDAEALVLDPSFRGTRIEETACQLDCPVEWHPGFQLSVSELQSHPEYRGPEYVQLGLQLSINGYLTPRIIGDAARTGRYDDQDLKRVWHYLARYGSPLWP